VTRRKEMKKINASLMAVAVALALIAFVAPSSAYSIETNSLTCDPESGETTWISTVSRDSGDKGISHWVVFWCNKDVVKEVWVNNEDLTDKYEQDPGWEYMPADHPDPTTGLQGIKIDYGFDDLTTSVVVKIVLDGDYCDQTSETVEYAIKHGNDHGNMVYPGTVFGPVVCDIPIPEFSTIAIPIASILGLLFFFNYRKRRKE
jgi:hypothetical protein